MTRLADKSMKPVEPTSIVAIELILDWTIYYLRLNFMIYDFRIISLFRYLAISLFRYLATYKETPNTRNTLCACGLVITEPNTGKVYSLVMTIGFETVRPVFTIPP